MTENTNSPELGSHAKDFLDLFQAAEELRNQIETEPDQEARAIACRSLGSVQAEMDLFAMLPETADQLREVVEYTPPQEDPATEGKRARLLEILQDPEHRLRQTQVSEDLIRQQLDRLPPEPVDFDPQVKLMSRHILINVFNHDLDADGGLIKEDENLTLADQPEQVEGDRPEVELVPPQNPAGNEGEGEMVAKPEVKIEDGDTVVFLKDMIMKLPDGRYISLYKNKNDTTGKKEADERLIAEYRAKALAYVFSLPDGEQIKTGDLRKVIMGEDTSLTPDQWRLNIIDFLVEELPEIGIPLIQEYKPTPKSKVVYLMRNADIDSKLHVIDRRSGRENRDRFVLSNGIVIGGTMARVMHLLKRTDREHYLGEEKFLDNEILSPRVITTKGDPSRALSDLISSQLRTTLRDLGVDGNLYRINKGSHPKLKYESGRAKPVYWMDIYLTAEKLGHVCDAAKFLIEHGTELENIVENEQVISPEKLVAIAAEYDGKSEASLEQQVNSIMKTLEDEELEILIDSVSSYGKAYENVIDILWHLRENKEELADFLAGLPVEDWQDKSDDLTMAAAVSAQSNNGSSETPVREQIKTDIEDAVRNVMDEILPVMYNLHLLRHDKPIETKILNEYFGVPAQRRKTVDLQKSFMLILRNRLAVQQVFEKYTDQHGTLNNYMGSLARQICSEYIRTQLTGLPNRVRHHHRHPI